MAVGKKKETINLYDDDKRAKDPASAGHTPTPVGQFSTPGYNLHMIKENTLPLAGTGRAGGKNGPLSQDISAALYVAQNYGNASINQTSQPMMAS